MTDCDKNTKHKIHTLSIIGLMNTTKYKGSTEPKRGNPGHMPRTLVLGGREF